MTRSARPYRREHEEFGKAEPRQPRVVVPIEPGDVELFGTDPYRSARSWHDAWMKSEARIRLLEEVREAARDFFVDVDGEAMCDAWDGHCTCSAFRLSAALAEIKPECLECGAILEGASYDHDPTCSQFPVALRLTENATSLKGN